MLENEARGIARGYRFGTKVELHFYNDEYAIAFMNFLNSESGMMKKKVEP